MDTSLPYTDLKSDLDGSAGARLRLTRSVCLLPLLHRAVRLRLGVLPGLHLITEQVEQEQRAQAAARALGAAARGHHVGRDAHAFFADDLQSLDQRDALRAERVDLFAISYALRLADQPHLLGLGLAGLRDVMSLAFGLGLALFGAAAGDLDADRGLHQRLLVVGVRAGLLQLDAFGFGLALRVEHFLALLGQNLLGLRLHQILRQADVADQHVDHVHVVFQQVYADAGLGAFLLLVAVLQISHRRRFRSLVAEDRINQRVHHVLNQPINRTDLGDHERRVFGSDPEDDANFELHSKAVF